MKRSLVGWFITVLAILLIMPCGVQSARKPVVTSHDETYVNKTIRFRVAWQADNPVVMVKIFAGGAPKEIKVDAYDNRRTRDGYSGEVSAVVELDPSFMEESIAYVIELEDYIRLRSDQVTGKLKVPQAGGAAAAVMPMPQQEDTWGKDMLGSSSTAMGTGQQMDQQMGQQGTTTVGGVVDKVIGVINQYDMPPVLGKIIISRVGVDGVSIGIRASDDKGLTGVSFKVYDNLGTLVQEDLATPTGKTWEGSSKFFNLANGNYKAVVQATDSSGNTSPEQIEFFAVSGAPQADTYQNQNSTDSYQNDNSSGTDQYQDSNNADQNTDSDDQNQQNE